MLSRTLCRRLTVIIVFAFLLAILSVSDASAQTTAFTYQGRLTSNSANASGNYDFTFTLFDALTGGTQVATLTKTGVTVTSGLFSVSLDFGASAFPGADRFLEISSKLSTDSTFTTLTPRQRVGPTPYAIRAQNASNADNATQLGGVSSSQYVTTTSGPTNFIQNQSASTQTANFKISGNGTAGGTLSGNILGIGTTSPNFRLHIVDNGVPSIRVDGSSTVGAWIQLNNTSTGGHNWGILSTGTNNGEGAGNLVMIDETGGGSVVIDDPLKVNGQITSTGAVSGTQYNIGSNRILGVAGASDLFVGTSAGSANTSGINNSFVGINAGQSNTNGNSNTYLGFGAGASSVSGVSNVAVGTNAGAANISIENTFIGAAAGQNNTTGLQNVFLGQQAGLSNTTENSNTFLGFSTNGSSGIFNATAIGANANVTRSNSLVLGSLTDSNGQPTDTFVGIGVSSPLVKLHVVESNLFRTLRLESSSTTGTWSELVNTSAGGHTWAILSASTSNGEGAGNLVFTDETGGGKVVMNAPLSVPSCTGCTNSSSDRNVKSNFAPVNGRSVLERLVGIPIQSWNYNSDPTSIRHIGPMAQDFYAAFKVGTDDKHINLLDEGGVALAAIQELYKINVSKDKQIEDLKSANADLTKRLETLEKAVEKLTRQQ